MHRGGKSANAAANKEQNADVDVASAAAKEDEGKKVQLSAQLALEGSTSVGSSARDDSAEVEGENAVVGVRIQSQSGSSNDELTVGLLVSSASRGERVAGASSSRAGSSGQERPNGSCGDCFGVGEAEVFVRGGVPSQKAADADLLGGMALAVALALGARLHSTEALGDGDAVGLLAAEPEEGGQSQLPAIGGVASGCEDGHRSFDLPSAFGLVSFAERAKFVWELGRERFIAVEDAGVALVSAGDSAGAGNPDASGSGGNPLFC